MRIIVLALGMGVVSFAGIALFLQLSGGMQQRGAGEPILTYVALLFSVVQLGLYFFVPGMVAAAQRRRVAAGKWPGAQSRYGKAGPFDETRALWLVYQTMTIVGLALLEGACFFLLMAFLIEGQWVAFVTAFVFLGFMVTRFPTWDRVNRWVETQRELIRGAQ
jgi:hypothetical protein